MGLYLELHAFDFGITRVADVIEGAISRGLEYLNVVPANQVHICLIVERAVEQPALGSDFEVGQRIGCKGSGNRLERLLLRIQSAAAKAGRDGGVGQKGLIELIADIDLPGDLVECLRRIIDGHQGRRPGEAAERMRLDLHAGQSLGEIAYAADDAQLIRRLPGHLREAGIFRGFPVVGRAEPRIADARVGDRVLGVRAAECTDRLSDGVGRNHLHGPPVGLVLPVDARYEVNRCHRSRSQSGTRWN